MSGLYDGAATKWRMLLQRGTQTEGQSPYTSISRPLLIRRIADKGSSRKLRGLEGIKRGPEPQRGTPAR